MSYLDLVEEYPRDYKTTLFEKILMATKRAKDLRNGKVPLLPPEHKEPYQALLEIREGLLELAYSDENDDESLEIESEGAGEGG